MTLAWRMDATGAPLQVRAAVRHISQNGTSDEPAATGVEFLNITSAQRLQIITYLVRSPNR